MLLNVFRKTHSFFLNIKKLPHLPPGLRTASPLHTLPVFYKGNIVTQNSTCSSYIYFDKALLSWEGR